MSNQVRIGIKARINDTERVLRALPEVAKVGALTYSLTMGKTGDGTGILSRYYVGYKSRSGAVLCWYEEGTMAEAANQALGKVHGFKDE